VIGFSLFRRSFYFLAKICISRNRLGLVSLGFIYISCTGLEKVDTHPINKTLQFSNNLLSSQRFRYFLFREFFRVDRGRLTFERLDLLVSFCLPNKSEL